MHKSVLIHTYVNEQHVVVGVLDLPPDVAEAELLAVATLRLAVNLFVVVVRRLSMLRLSLAGFL